MVKQIHEKFYSREFDLPDFLKFVASFAITDSDDRIITVGGVRPILELIAITDRSLPAMIRRSAYFNVLNASIYMGQKCGYDQLHVFAQGDRWIEALKKVGFRDTKGTALVMDVNNG